MTFREWTALMTERLKRRFPQLSVLDRNPGVCYVNGISAFDMVELVDGDILIVRHKDPLALRDGKLFSRHKGMTLERLRFSPTDEAFHQALSVAREHLFHGESEL